MRSALLLCSILFTAQHTFSQNPVLFPEILKDPNYQVLACNVDITEGKKNPLRLKEKSFFIENPADVVKFNTSLKVGRALPIKPRVFDDAYDRNTIQISLIKDKQEVATIDVNVVDSSIDIPGTETDYFFDPAQLEALAKKYPLNMRSENITLRSVAELKKLDEYKKQKNIIAYDDLELRGVSGNVVLYITKNAERNTCAQAEAFLNGKLDELGGYKSLYTCEETADNRFKIFTEFNKQLYEKLDDPGIKKQSWTFNKHPVILYIRN